MGTRMMVLPMERSPRIFQNGLALAAQFDDRPRERECGIGRCEERGARARPSTTRVPGRKICRLRFRKSKILCLAGLTPVANVDQATGESDGKVVRRR